MVFQATSKEFVVTVTLLHNIFIFRAGFQHSRLTCALKGHVNNTVYTPRLYRSLTQFVEHPGAVFTSNAVQVGVL